MSFPKPPSDTPIGWFGLVFPNQWQGFYLYSVENGAYAFEALADAGVITHRQAVHARIGDQTAIAQVVEAATDQMKLIFRENPESRAMLVYASLIAYVIKHPYFLIQFTDDATHVLCLSASHTIDEARVAAMEYPPVKDIEIRSARDPKKIN